MRLVILAIAALSAFPLASSAQQPSPPPSRLTADALLRTKPLLDARIDLDKLAGIRLDRIRRLGFEEGDICIAPPPAPPIDMHRSLFVHDAATLDETKFGLARTLQKFASDVSGSVSTNPESIFQQFLDTQNDTANQKTSPNPHCSDANGKVNGFPFNKCPRPEGTEASPPIASITARIAEYKPIALVNRIDLADKGWRNCGEHRIVYGKNGGGKNLIIFEAVLPNPKPGCRSGCRPVIDFWVDLSSDPNPASRATKLEQFFFTGLPGFDEVVKTTHYTSGNATFYGGGGSGQIRTNQFLGGGPWTLKEFKTFLTCSGALCDFDIFPTSVKVNPYGALWNRTVATGSAPPAPPSNPYATPIAGIAAAALAFEAEVAAQVTPARLAGSDLGLISYEVKPQRNSAESQSQSPTIDNYPQQFAAGGDTTFRDNLQALAAPFSLTGAQIVNRATANSCAGCHQPGAFGLLAPDSIASGKSWPAALSFVHVDTPPAISLAAQPEFDPAQFGGNANGFDVSPALLNEFLPSRRANLVSLAGNPVCDCVPRPAIVFPPPVRVKIPKLVSIIEHASVRTRGELAELDKQFLARRTVGADDLRKHFEAKRAVLARGEEARNKQLEGEGAAIAARSPKPQPIRLPVMAGQPARLQAVKAARLRQIVEAEPPRETINGSFRTH